MNTLSLRSLDDNKLDLNGITESTTNGNIQINGSEMNIYTHPNTHPSNMITGLATVATSGSASDVSFSDANFTSTKVSDALQELFQNVSNGKSNIASAITDKGVSASGSDTFAILATKITSIQQATGNVTAAQVLSGYTFSNSSGTNISGTMKNNSGVTLTTQDASATHLPSAPDSFGKNSEATYYGKINIKINPNSIGYIDSTTIIPQYIYGLNPAVVKVGQYIGNANGTTMGTYTSDANASASQIVDGYTAYVNGNKITGNIPIQGNNPQAGYQYPVATSSSGGNIYLKAPAGYYSQDTWIMYSANQNLIPHNIVYGKNILGVNGTSTIVNGAQAYFDFLVWTSDYATGMIPSSLFGYYPEWLGGTAYIPTSPGSMYITPASSGGSNSSGAVIYSKNSYNITGYKYLKVWVPTIGQYTNSNTVGVGTSQGSFSLSANLGTGINTLDVSSLSGNYFISLQTSSSNAYSPGSTYFNCIWLETL